MAKGDKKMPVKPGFTGKKQPTSDLKKSDGVVGGDKQGVGPRGKGPSGAGAGPKVGGVPMGVHNSFDNGVPGKGMDGISAYEMPAVHKANVDKSVLNTLEDENWGGAAIGGYAMPANNKIGS